MMPRLAIGVVVAWTLAGCALSGTGGRAHSGRGDGVWSLSTGLGSHSFRQDAPTFGVRTHQVIDDGFHLQSAVLHAGYDWHVVSGHLVLEAGLDVGGGAPLEADYGGTGAYAGLSPSIRWRFLGVDESELTFNLAAPTVELMLVPRAGLWMPPEGSRRRNVIGEYGVELGFRVAIASDLVVPAQGKVEDPPPPPSPAKPGTP